MLKKNKIRHSSKVKDDIGLIKIEEKDNQYLIEKIIGTVERNNLYVISGNKNWNYARNWKKTIGYIDVSTNLYLLALKTFLNSIYIHLSLAKSNNLMNITANEWGRRAGRGGRTENQLAIYKILLIFYVFFNFLCILMVVYHWPMEFYQCLIEKHLEVSKKHH